MSTKKKIESNITNTMIKTEKHPKLTFKRLEPVNVFGFNN